MTDILNKNDFCFLDSSPINALSYDQDGNHRGHTESIEELAGKYGLHPFVYPDGTGFAINFSKVVDVHAGYEGFNDETGRNETKFFPHLDLNILLKSGYTGLRLPFHPILGDGSIVVFEGGCFVAVPLAPEDVERMRTQSVDMRSMRTPRLSFNPYLSVAL